MDKPVVTIMEINKNRVSRCDMILIDVTGISAFQGLVIILCKDMLSSGFMLRMYWLESYYKCGWFYVLRPGLYRNTVFSLTPIMTSSLIRISLTWYISIAASNVFLSVQSTNKPLSIVSLFERFLMFIPFVFSVTYKSMNFSCAHS